MLWFLYVYVYLCVWQIRSLMGHCRKKLLSWYRKSRRKRKRQARWAQKLLVFLTLCAAMNFYLWYASSIFQWFFALWLKRFPGAKSLGIHGRCGRWVQEGRGWDVLHSFSDRGRGSQEEDQRFWTFWTGTSMGTSWARWSKMDPNGHGGVAKVLGAFVHISSCFYGVGLFIPDYFDSLGDEETVWMTSEGLHCGRFLQGMWRKRFEWTTSTFSGCTTPWLVDPLSQQRK